jgi:hypothetical protein
MGKELAKVKSEKATLFIHGKEREFRFNFSAWAKLEEEWGGLGDIEKIEKEILKKPFNTIPHLLYIALVDKEGVTEENILDEYDLSDFKKINDVFNKAFYGSLPQDEKKAEKEAKN